MKLLLTQLESHPGRANEMPKRLFDRLTSHIKETGCYPPIIVRRLANGIHQILDGHQRVEALKCLGIDTAKCDVWEVDDGQADMLLLTLNRLQGRDDPRKRGELLERLTEFHSIEALVRKLPEDGRKIRRLLDFTSPPKTEAKPPKLQEMPRAVTFFLTAEQRTHLLSKLGRNPRKRSEALMSLIQSETD